MVPPTSTATQRKRLYPLALLIAISLGLSPGLSAKEKKPGLSPAVSELIEILMAAPTYQDAKLSPGGTHLAYLHEIEGANVFDTFEVSTRRTSRLVANSGVNQNSFERKELSVADFWWTGPRQIVLAENQGDEFYAGLWVTDPELKRNQKLETFDRVLVIEDPLPQNASFALVSELGRELFGPQWRFNKSSRVVHEAEANPGRVIHWDSDVAGEIRLAAVAEKNGGWSYLYRETEKTPWQPLPLPPQSAVVTFDVTGRNVLIYYPGTEGRQQLQGFDLALQKLDGRPMANPAYDIAPSALLETRTHVPIGLRYETDKPKTLWLNKQFADFAKLVETTFPGHVVDSIGTLQGDEILFSIYSDTDPHAFYRYNGKKSEISPVLVSLPRAAAAKDRWSSMQPVDFPARDGTQLHGYLTLPKSRAATQKVPLVALSHGGPQARDEWGFDREVQLLSALGYAVLQVNYRGSSGYGARHMLNNTVEVAEKSVDDVADGIRWAIGEGYADEKRIVAFGASYGGYISLALATRYPSMLAGAIGFAGVYDWEAHYKHNTDEWMNPHNISEFITWQANYYLDPVKHASAYRAMSPINFVDQITCPVLLYHGGTDRRVQITQTNDMGRAMQKAGKVVEVVNDSSAVHGFVSEKQTRAYYEKVAAFLLKVAAPDAVP